MTQEVAIQQHTIDTLMSYVREHVDLETRVDPFYMNVPAELRERAFGSYLDTSVMETAYIYAHTQPIPLHVDRYKRDAVYNLCVPLYKTTEQEQRLLVFDQQFESHGMSWRLSSIEHEKHEPAGPEHQSTSNADNDHLPSEVLTNVRPADTPGVSAVTDQPLPESIQQLLPYGNEDFYYGLTGVAWHWRPGAALLFKSSQIHGTAVQSAFKIGCVVLMNSDLVQLDRTAH